MKTLIGTLIMLLGFSASAETLNIVSTQHLVGYTVGQMDIHLVVRQDGTITYNAGRQMPYIMKIQKVTDNRKTDGHLEITLSNGMILLQTSGFTKDRQSRLYLIFNSGEQIEMNAKVDLQIVK